MCDEFNPNFSEKSAIIVALAILSAGILMLVHYFWAQSTEENTQKEPI